MVGASSVVSSIYRSGKVYDLLYPGIAAGVTFWSELAKQYGDPILEIMCGTGFIAIPLAQRGHDVTGVYFPQELDALLWYNGFAIEHKYGGEDRRPFDGQSAMQYYVLRSRDHGRR